MKTTRIRICTPEPSLLSRLTRTTYTNTEESYTMVSMLPSSIYEHSHSPRGLDMNKSFTWTWLFHLTTNQLQLSFMCRHQCEILLVGVRHRGGWRHPRLMCSAKLLWTGLMDLSFDLIFGRMVATAKFLFPLCFFPHVDILVEMISEMFRQYHHRASSSSNLKIRTFTFTSSVHLQLEW